LATKKSKLIHWPGKEVVAGCDEAGRGCLSGPVTAAAVILPPNFAHPDLNDSKQLSEKKRDALRLVIEQEALAWAVTHISPEEIDEINILNASIKGMQDSLDQLKHPFDLVLVDGNRFHPYSKPHQCIIKGDGKYLAIAAASVLAKTHRDEVMMELHDQYPHYDWNKNKGYPTKAHRQGIVEHGKTPVHRNSFQLLPRQLEIPY